MRNRMKALEELETRRRKWKEVITGLLSEISKNYRDLLSRMDAVGDVKVVFPEDLEKAGLELSVGFRGVSPQVLDSFTQSGGERTTSIMCFLLSLQKFINSPVRAVDEFDIHMDPVNREAIMREIFLSSGNSQCIYVTPGQIPVDRASNVILVQSIRGKSEVKIAT
jgi:chromosome segregation protein